MDILNTITTEDESRPCHTRAAIQNALRYADEVDLSKLNLPSMPNAWTMDERALRFLVAIIRFLRPSSIVEFGSGLSTFALASASIQEQCKCSLVSLDHDPKYGRLDISSSLTATTCVSSVGILAPLVLRDYAGSLVPAYYYAEEAIADYVPADLIVIDGPPVLLGGRKGTLFQAMDIAREGTLVLLDDAYRKNEQESLLEWQRFFGHAIAVHMLPGFSRGLAAIVIRERVSSSKLFEHHQRLILNFLRQVIPEQQNFTILDDNYFTYGAPNSCEANGATDCVNPPPLTAPFDDESATAYLVTQLENGSEFVILSWPAFWWIDHFYNFRAYLQAHFVLLEENRLAKVFRVRH